jgi:hypothetical protein
MLTLFVRLALELPELRSTALFSVRYALPGLTGCTKPEEEPGVGSLLTSSNDVYLSGIGNGNGSRTLIRVAVNVPATLPD